MQTCNYQEKRSQDDILATAQEIQKWHTRIAKAKAAGRVDLLGAAQQREAALLRQGNQLWGHMQGIKERITQAKDLLRKVQQRRQEVQTKASQAQAQRSATQSQQRFETTGWWNSSNNNFSGYDELEDKFRNWEIEDELDQMKRNKGK